MTLDEFHAQIRKCQKCALSSSRTQVVCGDGHPHAEIMLVGEAPGFHEDRQGKPFVGAAGKLLDQLLEEIHIDRGEIYIANVIKCRPPDNRNPRAEEIASCKPYLLQQIELIEPKVIGTLGNFSTQVLLGKRLSITKVRGHTFNLGSYVVIPMLHPAAALHRDGLMASVREDFYRLRMFLDQGAQSLPSQPTTDQMSLF